MSNWHLYDAKRGPIKTRAVPDAPRPAGFVKVSRQNVETEWLLFVDELDDSLWAVRADEAPPDTQRSAAMEPT